MYPKSQFRVHICFYLGIYRKLSSVERIGKNWKENVVVKSTSQPEFKIEKGKCSFWVLCHQILDSII